MEKVPMEVKNSIKEEKDNYPLRAIETIIDGQGEMAMIMVHEFSECSCQGLIDGKDYLLQ